MGYRPMRAKLKQKPSIETYVYPGCDRAFATPEREHFDKPAAMMAYSRTMTLLRKVLGPVYGLNQLWEMPCYYEFGTRDVNAVMPTMVAQPYVNHVPTMTGGVGHDSDRKENGR
jgi:carboxymethylenebutenolidase